MSGHGDDIRFDAPLPGRGPAEIAPSQTQATASRLRARAGPDRGGRPGRRAPPSNTGCAPDVVRPEPPQPAGASSASAGTVTGSTTALFSTPITASNGARLSETAVSGRQTIRPRPARARRKPDEAVVQPLLPLVGGEGDDQDVGLAGEAADQLDRHPLAGR